LAPAFPPFGVVPVPPFGLGCGVGAGPAGGVIGIGGPPLPLGVKNNQLVDLVVFHLFYQ